MDPNAGTMAASGRGQSRHRPSETRFLKPLLIYFHISGNIES
jgi:hypothetical protein